MNSSLPFAIAALAIFSSTACGLVESDESKQGGGGEPPSSVVSLEPRCEPASPGAFQKLADGVLTARVGPCGHVAWKDESGRAHVVPPALTPITDVAGGVDRFDFSPSGRFVLTESTGGSTSSVHDLTTGKTIEVGEDLLTPFAHAVRARKQNTDVELALACRKTPGGARTIDLATGATTQVSTEPCLHSEGLLRWAAFVVGEGSARALVVVDAGTGARRELALPSLPDSAAANESWADAFYVASLGKLAIYTQRKSVTSGDYIQAKDVVTKIVDLEDLRIVPAEPSLSLQYSNGVTAFFSTPDDGRWERVFATRDREVFGPLSGEPRLVLDPLDAAKATAVLRRYDGDGQPSLALVDVATGAERAVLPGLRDSLGSPSYEAVVASTDGRLVVWRAGAKTDMGEAATLEGVSDLGLVVTSAGSTSGTTSPKSYRVLAAGGREVLTTPTQPYFARAGDRELVGYALAARSDGTFDHVLALVDIASETNAARELVHSAMPIVPSVHRGVALALTSDAAIDPSQATSTPKHLFAGSP